MTRKTEVEMAASARLFKASLLLYLSSVLTRTVLESLAYLPSIERFSRPLSGLLRFIVPELQMLTNPAVATMCLVLAIVVRQFAISSKIPDDASDDHLEKK